MTKVERCALSVERQHGSSIVLGAERGLHAKRRALNAKPFHPSRVARQRHEQLG